MLLKLLTKARVFDYFNNNFNGKTDSQTEYNETIIMLEKMIRALEKEICEIKKKMN